MQKQYCSKIKVPTRLLLSGSFGIFSISRRTLSADYTRKREHVNSDVRKELCLYFFVQLNYLNCEYRVDGLKIMRLNSPAVKR